MCFLKTFSFWLNSINPSKSHLLLCGLNCFGAELGVSQKGLVQQRFLLVFPLLQFLRVDQDKECNMECSGAPRKPLCASDGRTFTSRCEFLRAKCRDPQLEVIRGPCKGQVTSHASAPPDVPKRTKGSLWELVGEIRFSIIEALSAGRTNRADILRVGKGVSAASHRATQFHTICVRKEVSLICQK